MTGTSSPSLIAGADEAGRGALAGPVVAAAVLLHPDGDALLLDVADSKTLSPKRRGDLEKRIKSQAMAWAVASASVEEIFEINILHASLLAMKRAFLSLLPQPSALIVDGLHCPPGMGSVEVQALPRADASVPQVSAASILAKEERDRQMRALDQLYPEYEFARHKGYPTQLHRERLRRCGPSPQHRLGFRGVCQTQMVG